MKMQRAIWLAMVLVMGAVSFGELIDFESDSLGDKPNGFISVDSPLVSFTDSMGGDLDVYDYGEQSDGQALAIHGDDESYLIMDFTTTINSLQLDFGNDDPIATNPGDEAVLTAFLEGVQVDQVTVTMNRDDIMNQSISISGVLFDQATFLFDVTATNWTGMIEIVDNIQFVVPEPMTLSLLALGALLIRKRKA